jgi:HK97 gp10 family phage protein
LKLRPWKMSKGVGCMWRCLRKRWWRPVAKVDIKMPEDFLERISRLGSDFDPVAQKVLEAGGEIVLAKAQSNLSSVVGSGTKYEARSTGELEGALGLSSVKMDKNGNHNIKVGFAEPRSDGTSNAKLANIIEYGKHGQPAKPFMKPAKTASRAACISAMQNKFEEEVRKL